MSQGVDLHLSPFLHGWQYLKRKKNRQARLPCNEGQKLPRMPSRTLHLINFGTIESLYLLVVPKGAPRWRFDYRFERKRRTISLGLYPDVTLADARAKRNATRQLVVNGEDPSTTRRVRPNALQAVESDCFDVLAMIPEPGSIVQLQALIDLVAAYDQKASCPIQFPCRHPVEHAV